MRLALLSFRWPLNLWFKTNSPVSGMAKAIVYAEILTLLPTMKIVTSQAAPSPFFLSTQSGPRDVSRSGFLNWSVQECLLSSLGGQFMLAVPSSCLESGCDSWCYNRQLSHIGIMWALAQQHSRLGHCLLSQHISDASSNTDCSSDPVFFSGAWEGHRWQAAHTWETWMEFQLPGFRLTKPWPLQPCGQWLRRRKIVPSLCHYFKQNNFF